MDTRIRNAVAVLQTASFSRAASVVGVTQSAITKSVADLERQLGFPIFHRTSRGALPTEQGREFLDRASRLMADFVDLLEAGSKSQDPYRGVLRIGIFPAALEWMFTDALASLVRKRPSVRLQITTGASERGLQLLSRGDIDIALGVVNSFRAWPEFACADLSRLSAHCFVRRGHPLLALDEVTHDDIVAFDFVLVSLSPPYEDSARDLYISRGIDPQGRMHIIDYFPLVRSIVAQSDAISVLADTVVQSERFKRDFRVLDVPPVFPTVDVGYATRANWPTKPAARALISELASEVSAHRSATA